MRFTLTILAAMTAYYTLYLPDLKRAVGAGIIMAILYGVVAASLHLTKQMRAPRWQAALIAVCIIAVMAIVGLLSPSDEPGILYRGM